MARKVEFDYDKAIDRAMRLFWRVGYSNVSVRDLLKVMGIGEGSFYNTFKSKKRLYLECLKHYNDTVTRRRATALFSAPSAKMGVRALFRTVLDDLEDPRIPSRVCLMAGSVTCDVLGERILGKYVLGEISMFAVRFTERLSSAKEAGELPAQFDPNAAAQIITTYLQGLFQAALISYDRPQFERQIDIFLTGLGL